MKDIKAVIFDMDGLMFDTERLCLQAWEYVCNKLGYVLQQDVFMACIGRNSKDTKHIVLHKCGQDFPYDEFYDKAGAYMKSIMEKDGPPEKKGLRILLDFLYNNKIPCALATSSSKQTASWMIERAGLTQYFSAFSFGSEVTHGKPAPDIFINALELLNKQREDSHLIQAQNCVVLEDSPAGLRAAHSAKMNSIFIKDLIQPNQEELSFTWEQRESLEDVKDLLSNMMNK